MYLPDDLLTEIKVLAAQERSTLKELIGELLQSGLKARQQPVRQVALPPPYRPAVRMSGEVVRQLIREGR